MSDNPPSTPAEPQPVDPQPVDPQPVTTTPVEPVAEPAVVEPEPDAAPALVEPPAPAVEPVTSARETSATAGLTPEPPAPEQAAAVEPVVVAPEPAAASAAPQQVIYVAPPVPPKRRGNRVFGVLFSLIGAVVFGALYGVVSALIIDVRGGELFGAAFIAFLGNAFFWVPVAVFLLGMIVLVLLLNRAGWWAHVLGSLILAVAVYFGMIGLLLFIGNTLHGSPAPITFASLAVNPWVLAAAVVARESSIWIGLAIAARGRRVKLRNLEAREAFDREQEAKRAEYAGTGPAV
jgi:hypothetical protein